MRSGLLRRCWLPALLWGLGAGAGPPEGQALAQGRLWIGGFILDDDERLRAYLLPTQGKKGGATVAVPDCSALYGEVRSQASPLPLGGPAFPLQLSFGLVSHAGQPVVDLAKEYCEYTRTRDAPADVARTFTLLSLVGPALSLEIGTSESMGGGPPYHYQQWEARDVRSGQPIDVRELVDEASLAAALRQDPVIRERHDGAVPADATVDSLLKKLYPHRDARGSAFAFHQYDRAKGLVALRLGFVATACGMCPNRVSQLGLWVKPRPEMKDHFVEAAGAGGFYRSAPLPRSALLQGRRLR